MSPKDKQSLLITVAKMYYEYNHTQQDIASKLGLSRTYIGKLLNEARERGIVEIKVNDPLKSESELEERLRKKFGLKKTITIPTSNNDPLLNDKLGSAAAKYLDAIIKDNDIIGVAWGHTLHIFSTKVKARADLQNIQVVQMCGGITKINENFYIIETVKNIGNRLNGSYHFIPAPAVLDSITSKNTLVKDRKISEILSLARKANIAIFTVGAFNSNNTFVQAGYFSRDEFNKLKESGVIGDICSHLIDKDGNLCAMQIEKRTIGLSLEEISSIPIRICIAASKQKVDVLKAALKSGYINVLVTNEDMAYTLIK